MTRMPSRGQRAEGGTYTLRALGWRRRAGVLLVGALLAAPAGCGKDKKKTGGPGPSPRTVVPGAGPRAGVQAAERKVLKCGDIITAAQLEKILATQVVFDAASKPVCRIKDKKGGALTGNSSVQVFQGAADAKYEQMLAGAKASLAGKGTLNTSGSTGKRSFEFAGKFYGIDTVEVGFLDSSGRFAVLVTLGAGWAKLENARKLASVVDANLKKLK